jgi:ubiquinone biosynthesis protein UbiJ
MHTDVEALKKDVAALAQKIGDLDKATLYEVNKMLRQEVAKLTERVNKLENKRG